MIDINMVVVMWFCFIFNGLESRLILYIFD